MAFFGCLGELALGQIPFPAGSSSPDDVGAGYAEYRKRKLKDQRDIEDQERKDAETRREMIANAVFGEDPVFKWRSRNIEPIFTPQTGALVQSMQEASNSIIEGRAAEVLRQDDEEIASFLTAKDTKKSPYVVLCDECFGFGKEKEQPIVRVNGKISPLKPILMNCPECGKAIRRRLNA